MFIGESSTTTELSNLNLAQLLLKTPNPLCFPFTPPNLPEALQKQLSLRRIPRRKKLPNGRTSYDCFPEKFEVPSFKAGIHKLISNYSISGTK